MNAHPRGPPDERTGRCWSVALFVGMEAVLLAVYRDNLILNITMQFVPIKAVEAWQMRR